MASEHGLKTAAGLKLSKFLRDIGDETSEVEGLDSETGHARVITKAEALARVMWRMALGYEETTKIIGDNGKPTLVTKKHKPDMACITLIYDRLEGKVATNAESGVKKRPLAGRVDDQRRRRLNSMVGDTDDGDGAGGG